MGKISYEPNKEKNQVNEPEKKTELQVTSSYERLVESIDSIRPIGDTNCLHGIYLEDYVYTYIYQYAVSDLSAEHAGILLGEYHEETNETIICGMIPIPKHKLSLEEEWISGAALEEVQEEKERYFPNTNIVGWFHMQPGYGTMLTMKEIKVQRELFNQKGSLLLLLDPINKIETFYTFEDDSLKEQTGYYLYYDKNQSMQHYMLENPFMVKEKEIVEDHAVQQFREIGRMRKKEYYQRKRTNFTVIAASIAILAVGAVVIKMGDLHRDNVKMQQQLKRQQQLSNEKPLLEDMSDAEIKFVFPEQETAEVFMPVEAAENTPSEAEIPVDEATSSEGEDTQEEQPQMSEQLPESEEESLEQDTYNVYIVEAGDTLRKISQEHYGTELRTKEIIEINEIENGDHIYIGQELKLPVE